MNFLYRKAKGKYQSTGLAVIFFTIGMLILANSAQAALISMDSGFGPDTITLDTDANLELLDITLSTNRSFNEVSSQFGPGGDFEGFRHATPSEVEGFFSAAGILGSTSDVTDFPLYIAVTELFGVTDYFPSDPTKPETLGLMSDIHVGAIFYGQVAGVYYYTAVASSTWGFGADYGTESCGHWLVRPVSEPVTMLLVGFGLIVLAGFRRET